MSDQAWVDKNFVDPRPRVTWPVCQQTFPRNWWQSEETFRIPLHQDTTGKDQVAFFWCKGTGETKNLTGAEWTVAQERVENFDREGQYIGRDESYDED